MTSLIWTRDETTTDERATPSCKPDHQALDHQVPRKGGEARRCGSVAQGGCRPSFFLHLWPARSGEWSPSAMCSLLSLMRCLAMNRQTAVRPFAATSPHPLHHCIVCLRPAVKKTTTRMGFSQRSCRGRTIGFRRGTVVARPKRRCDRACVALTSRLLWQGPRQVAWVWNPASGWEQQLPCRWILSRQKGRQLSEGFLSSTPQSGYSTLGPISMVTATHRFLFTCRRQISRA